MDENNVCVQWPQSLSEVDEECYVDEHINLFFTLSSSLTLSFCHRGKTNYINLGSFLIKPVQRVMRYPLLLMELLNATPESHHDRKQLAEAVMSIKEINVNINEFKRRKDLGIFVYLSYARSVCLSFYHLFCLCSIYLSIYLSIYRSVCHSIIYFV